MRRIFLENLLANYLKNGILEKWLIFFRSDSDLGWHLWMLNFRGNNNNSNISKKIKKKPQMHSNNRSCLIATNAKRHQLKNREYKYQSISLSIYLCIYTYIYIYMSTKPAGTYMFNVNNRNTRTRCKTCWASFWYLYY